jgi:hypothetical protein
MLLLAFNKRVTMTEKTSLELPNEIWRVVHAMLVERPVARYVAFPAINAFEQAMEMAGQAASRQQPAPSIEGTGE